MKKKAFIYGVLQQYLIMTYLFEQIEYMDYNLNPLDKVDCEEDRILVFKRNILKNVPKFCRLIVAPNYFSWTEFKQRFSCLIADRK